MYNAILPTDLFDIVFEDMSRGFFREPSKKLAGSFYGAPNYPPSDVYISEDKTLNFTFAMAGFKEDEIRISFDSDKMIVSSKTTSKKDDSVAYLRKGIAKRNIEVKEPVPFSRYDVDKAQASFVNGILHVSIPIKESAKPREIEINSGKNEYLTE